MALGREDKMKHASFQHRRLTLRLALLATTLSIHPPPATSQEHDEGASFSAIILEADRLIYRDDKDVVVPNDPDAVFIGEVYQAHIRRIKTLSGPEVPHDAVVMFVGSHLMSRSDGVSALKVFMVVRRDDDGYWGGQQWMKVGSKLCLGDDAVAELGLKEAFSKAKRQKTGELCIKV